MERLFLLCAGAVRDGGPPRIEKAPENASPGPLRCQPQKPVHGHCTPPDRENSFLQQNADQAGAAVVDDLFQCFLQTGAGLLGHVQQFVLQPFVDQLVQAFAEDV